MILDRILERRASPENPSTSLANPAAWLGDAFGASDVYSGAKVSEWSAMNYAAFFACMRVLAETVAVVPLKLYERLVDGGRREAREHRVYDLVHRRPNPEMSSFQFREVLQGHVASWGNAYAEVERSEAGVPLALWPLRPDRARVERRNGEPVLVYSLAGGGEVVLSSAAGEYLHVAGFGFDGVHGYSLVRMAARQVVGLGLATEEFGARWFGGGGKPPLVLKYPGKLSPEASGRMRAKFDSVHGSLSQAQRTMILDEGLDVEVIGIPNDDAQFLETRRFQIEEMARICRIPLHKLQHLEKATFSNIEHQSIEFVQDTALPWAVRWEQALGHVLLTPAERRRYFVEFNLDGLLRGDAKSRADALSIQRQWGIINADEWRALENRNPQPDGLGQEYLVPMNYVSAGSSSPAPSAERVAPHGAFVEKRMRSVRSAGSRHKLALSYVQVFERAAAHFVNREARAALRILKRAIASDAPVETLFRELFAFWETFGIAIRRELAPVVASFAEGLLSEVVAEVGTGDGQDLRVELMASDYVDGFIDRHIGKSRGAVEGIISDSGGGAELWGPALEERFIEWQEFRAGQLAQGETIRAAGALSKAAYLAVGVTLLRWVSLGDSCDLCASMDGRVVGKEQFFLGAGDVVDPGVEGVAPLVASGSISHPPLHNGCDCMIVAE